MLVICQDLIRLFLQVRYGIDGLLYFLIYKRHRILFFRREHHGSACNLRNQIDIIRIVFVLGQKYLGINGISHATYPGLLIERFILSLYDMIDGVGRCAHTLPAGIQGGVLRHQAVKGPSLAAHLLGVPSHKAIACPGGLLGFLCRCIVRHRLGFHRRPTLGVKLDQQIFSFPFGIQGQVRGRHLIAILHGVGEVHQLRIRIPTQELIALPHVGGGLHQRDGRLIVNTRLLAYYLSVTDIG